MPTQKQSFWEYITSNVGNHLMLLGTIALIIGGVVGYNYIKDMQAKLANQEKIAATLSQQFTEMKDGAAITGNQVEKDKQLQQLATNSLGQDVMHAMQSEDAKILALVNAMGQINAQVSNISQTSAKTFDTSVKDTSTGTISNYPIEQTRSTGPATTAFHLYYDPTKPNPNDAFSKSFWENYGETYNVALGEWQKKKDGGMATTVKLTRTITKPDPNDSTKTITVGTEDINIKNAETTYTPEALVSTTTVPRWTLSVGISKNTSNKYNSVGIIDYRFTNRLGAFAGTVNGGLAAGVSIRLDGTK